MSWLPDTSITGNDLTRAPMDSKSEVSLPLLRKIDKILQRDSTLKISHHSLILEVLNRCNEGSINFHSEHADGNNISSKKTKIKPHLSSKARHEFTSLTDYQSYTQNLTLKIRNHFTEVVGKIADFLQQNEDQNRPEIWASYEALFFTSTITDIEKFYVLAYDGEAKLLQMLLPTADPRNMKLRGEWVIDILDPSGTTVPGTAEKCTQTDPTSSDEEDSGTPVRRATASAARQGFHRRPKALEDLETHRSTPRGVSSGDCTEDNQLCYVDSVSHVSLASNLVEEMESLYPFLRDVTHGSTDLSNLPAITPHPEINQIEQKNQVQSGKQRLSRHPKLQKNHGQTKAEGPVSFEEMFNRAYKCLRMVLQERLPLVKLRWLVMCLQALSDSVKEHVSRTPAGANRSIGTDDLLPSLILFLIKGDPGQVTALYPQLKFLEDYLPDFVATGIIGFTTAQFSTAFAFIIQTDDGDT